MTDFLFIVMIFALCFLFYGDPDVWDMLHKTAMGVCK